MAQEVFEGEIFIYSYELNGPTEGAKREVTSLVRNTPLEKWLIQMGQQFFNKKVRIILEEVDR